MFVFVVALLVGLVQSVPCYDFEVDDVELVNNNEKEYTCDLKFTSVIEYEEIMLTVEENNEGGFSKTFFILCEEKGDDCENMSSIVVSDGETKGIIKDVNNDADDIN